MRIKVLQEISTQDGKHVTCNQVYEVQEKEADGYVVKDDNNRYIKVFMDEVEKV